MNIKTGEASPALYEFDNVLPDQFDQVLTQALLGHVAKEVGRQFKVCHDTHKHAHTGTRTRLKGKEAELTEAE